MKISEYYKLLNAHDWYYCFSDDSSVASKGYIVSNRLRELATLSPAHAELYNAFHRYAFSGEAFGNEKQPKPEPPKENEQ